MKLVLRIGLAAIMQTCWMLPASAQWQSAVGISQRQVTNTEYDKAGRQLVRESGWLPGAALNAAYQAGRQTWFAEADISKGRVGYHGQSQAGVAAESRTSMALAALRIGGAYALGDDYAAQAALEWERSTRDIIGIAGTAGLQETYRTRRLVAGAQKTWRPVAAGAAAVDAAVVLSEPERLRVGFSGLLDSASLDTKRSHGFRIGASIRPAFAPWLELRSRFAWAKVARSADAPVTLHGQFRGTIAQPEHEARAVTLTASAIF
ncbi:MAG TPA: hypothetical protein VFS02_22910 [Telluria sp.]|nr:hypothetical protein [Telluria sp.]